MVGPSPASSSASRPHERAATTVAPLRRDAARPRRRALAAAEAEEAALDAAEQAGDKGDAPPVADAAADLAREAAGVAAGAVVADPRASLVALPRGATGVEWGTDLSFVGVYVRALLPGGAAEQSGAVAPGDQLVAIDGDAVFDATFDAAMARLAAVDAEARLEFFRGDRTELLAAVGRSQAAPGAATITVDDRGERREIVVEAGANLRDALVKDGIDVYRGTTAWTNCAGHQMCGTCIVDVVGGAAATNRKSNDEEGTLNLQGCEPSCRPASPSSTATSRCACGRTGTGASSGRRRPGTRVESWIAGLYFRLLLPRAAARTTNMNLL